MNQKYPLERGLELLPVFRQLALGPSILQISDKIIPKRQTMMFKANIHMQKSIWLVYILNIDIKKHLIDHFFLKIRASVMECLTTKLPFLKLFIQTLPLQLAKGLIACRGFKYEHKKDIITLAFSFNQSHKL